jgi:hypothetical protein
MKSVWRKTGVWVCSFWLMAAPALGQWAGHLTKLSVAQLACQTIDSSACLPFLAEAVAVADTLTTQASVRTGNDKDIIQLPGADGSSARCSERFTLRELNGVILTHLALIRDPHLNFYWSNALFVAALGLCRTPST